MMDIGLVSGIGLFIIAQLEAGGSNGSGTRGIQIGKCFCEEARIVGDRQHNQCDEFRFFRVPQIGYQLLIRRRLWHSIPYLFPIL